MTLFLFDVGNVLVKADHHRSFAVLEQYGVAPDRAEEWYHLDTYRDFSSGLITEQQFCGRSRRYFKKRLSNDCLRRAHDCHISAVDRETLDILIDLRDKYGREQCGLATNTNPWQSQRVDDLLDVRGYVSPGRIFQSDELGVLKPDSLFFVKIRNALPSLSEIVFIDDRLANCKAAQEHGLKTHQFYNSQVLQQWLEEEGYL